ncbi:ras family small GTPase [Reticulomyxa filosa]|uniref:Ras family small GTPase n=1 Tax=Reticulomyxa filosa TaxID=46433 RepID=X6M0E4_RETFI|nr:ras family small GTPase [Reticulomyxa filosa]|eukprot:ETO06425.1 ras family small GTPase [Reticulomyxa filosa]
MKDKDGFVLVFSIIQHKSFDELRGFYESLCEVYDDKIPPFVLVGNKADLDNPEVLETNPEKYRREVTREEAIETAHKWGAIRFVMQSVQNKQTNNTNLIFFTLSFNRYIETSALTGQNHIMFFCLFVCFCRDTWNSLFNVLVYLLCDDQRYNNSQNPSRTYSTHKAEELVVSLHSVVRQLLVNLLSGILFSFLVFGHLTK